MGAARAGSSFVFGLPMHFGFSHLKATEEMTGRKREKRHDQELCLHEHADMGKYMFKNPMDLMDLQGYDSEAQPGE